MILWTTILIATAWHILYGFTTLIQGQTDVNLCGNYITIINEVVSLGCGEFHGLAIYGVFHLSSLHLTII